MQLFSKIILMVLAVFWTTFAWGDEGVVVKVIDGDTIVIRENGQYKKIGIRGIDAPDLQQAYGLAAKKELEKLLLNDVVYIDQENYRNGRNVAEIFVKDRSRAVSWDLVENGLAWCDDRLDRKNPLNRLTLQQYPLCNAELQATINKIGLWSQPSDPPWKWKNTKNIEPSSYMLTTSKQNTEKPNNNRNIQKKKINKNIKNGNNTDEFKTTKNYSNELANETLNEQDTNLESITPEEENHKNYNLFISFSIIIFMTLFLLFYKKIYYFTRFICLATLFLTPKIIIFHKLEDTDKCYKFDENNKYHLLLAIIGTIVNCDENFSYEERLIVKEFLIKISGYSKDKINSYLNIVANINQETDTFVNVAKKYYLLENDINNFDIIVKTCFLLSISDGIFSSEEKIYLNKLCNEFNLDYDYYENMFIYISKEDDYEKYYTDLGLKKDSSIELIKKKYKEFVKKYHPDKLLNSKISDKEKTFAKNQFHKIQTAYEKIKEHRNFS